MWPYPNTILIFDDFHYTVREVGGVKGQVGVLGGQRVRCGKALSLARFGVHVHS